MEGNPEPGEQRVDYLGRQAFERAVAQAATIATQAVAQVHRRRLVVQSGVTTFIVAVGVALVMAFALKNAADDNARQLAVSNCHLVTGIATPLANFVNSDAALRQKQAALASNHTVIGQRFSKLLGAQNYLKAVRESNTLNAQTVTFWQRVIVPQLRAVAGADCLSRLP